MVDSRTSHRRSRAAGLLLAAILLDSGGSFADPPQDGVPQAAPTEPHSQHSQTVEERRRRHLDGLRAQWGSGLLARPEVLPELSTHAWRMARLNRLLDLATAHDRMDAAAKVRRLISMQVAMHRRRMQALWFRYRRERLREAGAGASPSRNPASAKGSR